MSEQAPIQITETLRIVCCQECAQPFAVTRPLFLNATARRLPIFCPAGHSFTPGDPDKPFSNALQINAELTAALHDSRRQVTALAQRLAALTSPDGAAPPPSKAELLRRARILESRADKAEYGRKLCHFCGKKARFLVEHIRRCHPAALADMDASAFD